MTEKGRVFSINISGIKGVSKIPIKSAFLIEGHGLDKDAHALGGIRQVSLLSIESIKKQKACAKIENSATSLKAGDFAENITTEGIDLSTLKIGDNLTIGGTVTLKISKIGKECHKYCSIYYKIGDCIMPREGIFAQVLKGGEIKIGDNIEGPKNAKRTLVERSPERAKRVEGYKVAILTISDRCSRGEMVDQSGKDIIDTLKKISAEILSYDIVPDEIDLIKKKLIFYCDSLRADFVFTTGGTGFGPRDVTPEATNAVAERIVPGISELIRLEGLKNTKNAMLSRGVSAIRKNSVIINLPGSPKGVKESLAAILDIVPHAFDMLKGGGHEE